MLTCQLPKTDKDYAYLEQLPKKDFIAYQNKLAKTAYPTRIVCGCGSIRPIRFMYRCLYCGEYYCFTCAELHFGQTVKDYKKSQKGRE
jgi:hypothetical protein